MSFWDAVGKASNEEIGKAAAVAYRDCATKPHAAIKLTQTTGLSLAECERLIEAIDAYEDGQP